MGVIYKLTSSETHLSKSSGCKNINREYFVTVNGSGADTGAYPGACAED
jgi:hypothetical protein